MTQVFQKLWADEAGFLVSSELVLVSTILVLSMVVGLSEVSRAVNHELADVASAFSCVNQSYRYDGLFSPDKSGNYGSSSGDSSDYSDVDIVASGWRSEY